MIIVGLGNPGKKYEATRHNVGFLVLDRLAHDLGGTTWKQEQDVAWSRVGQHYLVKPMEFMNNSGPALQRWLTYKHMTSDDPRALIVVHDDVDFPLGEIHEQADRSAAGHNGVQSIIEALGTQNFTRLRIGIGNNRDADLPAEDYVLKPFTADEQSVIEKAVDQAVELIQKKVTE